MKIFLDTNIFHNHWFMKNANFKYLFHFLNNEGYELIISSLVIEEVENNQNKEFINQKRDFIKIVKNLNNVSENKIEYDINCIKNNNYNFHYLLDENIENITIIDYETISHKEVIERALQNKKPFKQGEKGYRDTLIWLSFLKYLKLNKITDDVIFITENTTDFFKSRSKNIEFFDDLTNDILNENLTCSIKPFNSLFNFVDSTIDKQAHAIDYNAGDIEYFLEHEGISALELIPDNEIINYLSDSPHNNLLKNDLLSVESINYKIMEGLEDEIIIHANELSNNEVFVQYDYNLRIVTVEIEISKIEYLLNENEFDNKFYNIEEDENSVFISFFPRIYYTVSLVYNSETKEISNFEIDDLAFI